MLIGTEHMNLAVLKKSRRKPNIGDVFVMLPPDGFFLYGRVIATDANGGGFPRSNLIYIYRPRSKDILKVPQLLRGQLLVPPIMTNNLPWTRGYFQLVENRELSAMDRLEQHCFKDSRGWYFDEYGKQLSRPSEPIGDWGLHSFLTIDELVCKALGIKVSSHEQ